MKKTIWFCLLMISLSSFKKDDSQHYVLVKIAHKQMGHKNVKVAVVNIEDVKRLNEPLKALAAFYSCLAGSNCDDGKCELTTALFNSAQGSVSQKNSISKWFSNNVTAKKVLAQNCFVSSSSSSSFADYALLEFLVSADTVKINYAVNEYDHGKSSLNKGQDLAIIKSNQVLMIKQNIWKK